MRDVLDEWNEDKRGELYKLIAASPYGPEEFRGRLDALHEGWNHSQSMDRAAAKLAEMKRNNG